MPRIGWLDRLTTTRHALRALDRLATAQEAQLRLLTRLTDHLVGPEVKPAEEPELREVTGVSYSRDAEQGKILDFITRTERDTGRSPTEDEVIAFLDGKPA